MQASLTTPGQPLDTVLDYRPRQPLQVFTSDGVAQIRASSRSISGTLVGDLGAITERLGQYVDAGAQWVILALRAPFDFDGLDLFIREVMPKFRKEGPL